MSKHITVIAKTCEVFLDDKNIFEKSTHNKYFKMKFLQDEKKWQF